MPSPVDKPDDWSRVIAYATVRCSTECSQSEAARRANIARQTAKSWEMSPWWEDAVEKAKQINDLQIMRTAARQRVMEAVTGENQEIPEHTRLQTAWNVLQRIDPEFYAVESPHKKRTLENDSDEDFEAESLSDEELDEELEEVTLALED